MNPKDQVELLSRGCVELVSPEELEKKIVKKTRLTVKLGFDPTMADLHLGHTVVMQKLKQFQDLGHQVVFLIGDFTAQIGDPSGRNQTRPTLIAKEVEKNAKTYLDQAFKILDKRKTKVCRNSEWFKKQHFLDAVLLGGHYNIARMLEREDFKKRLREGNQITVQEFMYPLIQGYDSVALEADVEIGGQDQKFNLAVARDVQRSYGIEPEVFLTMPLLIGTDGVKKMSKSYGNYIGITESPKQMFGKIMSLSDELMLHYYTLLTDEELGVVKTIHPKEAKIRLGKTLVERFHSAQKAEEAAAEFDLVFSGGGKPADIPELKIKIEGEVTLVDLLVSAQLVPSKGEARRLIQQGGVKVDDVKVEDIGFCLAGGANYLLQAGKRKFLKIIL